MGRQGAPGQYARPTVLQVLARTWGCQPSTAQQFRTNADPRSLGMRLARAITALRHHGYPQEADALARPVLLALAPLPLAVSKEDVIEALCAEQEAEGLETAAQVACTEWSPAALETWVKRALVEYDRQGAAIRLVRAYLGQEAL